MAKHKSWYLKVLTWKPSGQHCVACHKLNMHSVLTFVYGTVPKLRGIHPCWEHDRRRFMEEHKPIAIGTICNHELLPYRHTILLSYNQKPFTYIHGSTLRLQGGLLALIRLALLHVGCVGTRLVIQAALGLVVTFGPEVQYRKLILSHSSPHISLLEFLPYVHISLFQF
jgi:hypothetical protein